MFWKELFASIGPWWEVLPMSGLCAAVITLTFVHAELFQSLLLRTLKGILRDNHLMRTAVNVEPENMQMDMLISSMATVRDDESVRQPIEEKIGRVVRKRLAGFADNFTDISETDDSNIIEGTVISARPTKQIAAPKPRGEYQQRKAELQQYLADHSNASVREIAAHFGKSPSTISDWLNKNRAGL